MVGDIQVIRNRDLHPNSPLASFLQPIARDLNVLDGGESSVAVSSGVGSMSGTDVLWTSNNADGISTDGGFTFSYLDPATVFGGNSQPPGTGKFCCDQVVTYVPSVRRFVWILQYEPNPVGAIRIATATAGQFDSSGGRNWTTYTFYPRDWGITDGSGVNLDRPHIAFTRRFLYLTVGDYRGPSDPPTFKGTIVMRIRLGALGRRIPYQYLELPAGSSKVRPAQDASPRDTVQFFAGAADINKLNIYKWSDSSNLVTEYDMGHASVATGNATSNDPSGANWLDRWGVQAGTVETGAKVGNSLLFGWEYGTTTTFTRDGKTFETVHSHDQPGLGFIVINSDLNPPKKIAYQNIEFADYAATLPMLRTDTNGDTALSFMWGGPTRYASHAVGFLINYAMATTVRGQQPPEERLFGGDYVGLTNVPGTQCFAASGSATMGMSPTATDWYIDPHFIIFGRTEDNCAVPRRTVIPPPANLPDLVIDSIDVSGNSILINERNAGTAAAGASQLSYNFNGGPNTLLDTPALDPGQAHTFTVSCPSSGTVTVNALADANNVVAESNESNNGRSATVNCGSTTTSTTSTTTPMLPDLVVTSVHGDPSGKDICSIYADVSNIGNAPAAATQTEFRDNQNDPPAFDQLIATPALAPGQTTTVIFARSYGDLNVALVTADATNAVAESNENNNSNTGNGAVSTNGRCRYP